MAQAFSLRLAQTVAIGDGANDVLRLETAGLGIAFRAKPLLQEAADLSFNHERLDALLVRRARAADHFTCNDST